MSIDAFEIQKAIAMLTGYAARWPLDEYEVLGVEVEFRAPLINPETGAESKTFVLGGKLDALVRDKSGDVYIVEHKTSGEDITPGSMYWKRLRLDSQCSTYLVGVRAMGHEPKGIIYDVLGKPKLKPLEANSRRPVAESPEAYGQRCADAIMTDPDAYYQRGPVVRLIDEEREAALDLWQTAQTMRDYRRLKLAPRTPEACTSYGSTCQYFAACVGEAALSGPLYEDAELHEELSQVDGDDRRLITNSEVRAFRKCARFHHNRYVELRRPSTTASNLYFGSMVHRGLEQLWLGRSLDEAIDAMLTPPAPRSKKKAA